MKELAALSNENRQLRETVDKSKTEREKLMKTIGELETNRQVRMYGLAGSTFIAI